MDHPSLQGRFGWHAFEPRDDVFPFLMRSDGSRLVAKRLVDAALDPEDLGRSAKTWREVVHFEALKPTSSEMKLLNEINFWHCDGFFGPKLFGRVDCLVKLDDVVEAFGLFEMTRLLMTGQGRPRDDSSRFTSSSFIHLSATSCSH